LGADGSADSLTAWPESFSGGVAGLSEGVEVASTGLEASPVAAGCVEGVALGVALAAGGVAAGEEESVTG